MKNTMNLTINNATYNEVPIEIAKAIETMLATYKVTTKVETTKSEPKKSETKKYAKVYEVTKDGKGVTIGNGGFIPTKVFKGVTYDLKQNGAKYDAKTKVWSFETKKACTEWCKRQDARG